MMGRLRHLIVVVPGIGGSVLADALGRPVWGDTRRRVVQVLKDPGRLSLAESPTLHPIGLMATAGHVPPFRLHGYDGLVRGLRNGLGAGGPVRVDTVSSADGYERDRGADVVLFPYDFRYGVREAAVRLADEIGVRMADVPSGQKARRVIVVGHSMGGLVARSWAGLPGQARLCRAILTLGTPHLGAPKALDWVVNGASLGPGPIRAATARLLGDVTEVLRGWQAVYDLLPTYQAILDETDASGPPQLRPADLVQRLGCGFVAERAYASGVNAAAEMHDEIRRAWFVLDPAVRPPVLPFLARDHGTPNAAYVNDGRLMVTDEDPHWQPNVGWRGDGTVPAISAVPAELQGQREAEHPVTHRHTPMVSAGSVVQVIRALTGDSGPVRGDETFDSRTRLGVDLDDAVMLGEPVPVRARLTRPGDGIVGGTGPGLWLLAAPSDHSREASRVPMTADGDGWTTTFVPSTPGAWQMTVEVTGLSGQSAPSVTDVIGVIDPDIPAGPHDGGRR
jgi:hypothetical protein